MNRILQLMFIGLFLLIGPSLGLAQYNDGPIDLSLRVTHSYISPGDQGVEIGPEEHRWDWLFEDNLGNTYDIPGCISYNVHNWGGGWRNHTDVGIVNFSNAVNTPSTFNWKADGPNGSSYWENDTGGSCTYNSNGDDNLCYLSGAGSARAIRSITPPHTPGTTTFFASGACSIGNRVRVFYTTPRPADVVVNSDMPVCPGGKVNITAKPPKGSAAGDWDDDIVFDYFRETSPGSGSFTSACNNCSGNVNLTMPNVAGMYKIRVKAQYKSTPNSKGFLEVKVTVGDNEPPKLTCPANMTVNSDPGECSAKVKIPQAEIVENCGLIALGYRYRSVDNNDNPTGSWSNFTNATHTTLGVGRWEVQWGARDVAGQTGFCSFYIKVKDNEKPSIDCPSDISMGTDPGVCGAEVDFTPAEADDNCGIKNVKARYRPVDKYGNPTGSWTSRMTDPSGFFAVGRYEIQWRAVDVNGKKKSCSHYLEVYDDEDPVAVCKDVTVDFNGEPDVHLSVSQVWNEAASSDNCDHISYVGTAPSLTIDCEDVGETIPLTVTIKDKAGNTDKCTANVKVIGLPCGWSEGPEDGSLNCDGDTSSDYDPDDESFTLTSDGCWHDCRDADRATYVYHPLCGDGTLTAKLASINTKGYAGLMARESLDPWARRAGVLKDYSTRRVRREWRAAYGGIVSQSHSNRSRVKWMRIVRKGDEIKSYTSSNGSSWRLLYKVKFTDLDDCIYVGMMTYSRNGSAEVEAVFEDVSITGNGISSFVNNNTTTIPTSNVEVGNIGDINIFPNPVSDQAQIVLKGFQDKPVQLVVRDTFGKVVKQIKTDAADVSLSLDVQDLSTGVYLITLIQEQQVMVSKRLVIQR